VDPRTAHRDLSAFLVFFPIALLLGLGTPLWLRAIGAAVLLLGYAAYVVRTARASGGADVEEVLEPLRFDTTKDDPPSTPQIAGQLVVSIGLIVGGAELFVGEVEAVATSLGVSSLVLALVLAPLATELPEKINSIIWVRQDKDALAIGNVTGAMSFQASVPVTLGLVLTPWDLTGPALVAGVLALAGGIVAYVALGRRDFGLGPTLGWIALFAAFFAYVLVA